MLSHDEFARLRLSRFAAPSEIVQLENWEFLGREWIGEAIGFSEWLRPVDAPEMLGSLALDFSALPQQVTDACLASIGLPVTRGMDLGQLTAILGEPCRTQRFAEDRTNHEFRVGDVDAYEISCTVLAEGGLTYLIVTAAPFAGHDA